MPAYFSGWRRVSFAPPVLNMRAEGTNPPPEPADLGSFSAGALYGNAPIGNGQGTGNGDAIYEYFLSIMG